MPLQYPITAIVNPHSASGKTASKWPEIRQHLEMTLGPVRSHQTHAPQHAIELTRSAIREGSKTIIAVGGDGTINEVVNGFFVDGAQAPRDTVLAIIPQGTGSDLQRTLSIPMDEKAAIEIIRKGTIKAIDVERVRYQDFNCERRERYALNITSFGMGGMVAARASRYVKALGGKVGFMLATGVTTLKFSGNTVTLHFDGKPTPEIKITNVAVGNGQFHGAGMWICPRAVVDDGLLDVTVVRYLSLLEILARLSLLYNGRVYEHPKVEFHRVSRIEATARERTLIEIDGEPLGQLPLEISVIPRAIRLVVADA